MTSKSYVVLLGFQEVVKGWINNPPSNNGVAIVADATLTAVLRSREGAASGATAFLEIDVNPTAGAVGATTLAVTSNATVGGTLGVTGRTTLNDFVTIGNNKALTISGSGSLGVGGNINCSNDISAFRDLFADGNVGIGTTTPTNKLQIESTSNPQVMIKNTGTGGFAGINTQTSFGSRYFGCRNNTSNWTVFSNDDGAHRLSIQQGTGNVGIGLEAPATKIHVNGVAFATAFTPVSDRRLKKDFTEITGALDLVQKLRPVSYYWRRDECPEMGLDERRHLGFIHFSLVGESLR